MPHARRLTDDELTEMRRRGVWAVQEGLLGVMLLLCITVELEEPIYEEPVYLTKASREATVGNSKEGWQERSLVRGAEGAREILSPETLRQKDWQPASTLESLHRAPKG